MKTKGKLQTTKVSLRTDENDPIKHIEERKKF